MSYKKPAIVFSSILMVTLATVTAWATDPMVSPSIIPVRQSAIIIQDNGVSPLRASENASHTILFEGANWKRASVITWSLATHPGTAVSPFSGYMGSQYEGLLQQVFQTWAEASGLTFEEIADSSRSDIRVGWGDFNTATTGIVGHTACMAQSGEFLPGGIIRFEDPSQDPLAAGTVNALTYSGTNANLKQIMLHEIGHALGMADNDDPNSIMYYEATGSNNTLARNDVAAIQELYGSRTIPTQVIQVAASELSGPPMSSAKHRMNRRAAAIQANQTAPAHSSPWMRGKLSISTDPSNPQH
jgi:hypothetical protein